MAIASSIFFAASLILAIVLGPQTRSWSWGPSLLCLGLSLAFAIPRLKSLRNTSSGFIAAAGLTVVWFTWRAWLSPVREFAEADLLLMAATIGSFIITAAWSGSRLFERIFLWTLSAMLIVSTVIVAIQVKDPSFAPVFPSRPAALPSGFFGHYNDGANFLAGASLVLGAAALFGNFGKSSRLLWMLIAIGGVGAVYFTRSRGGILAAGGGFLILSIMALLVGNRRKAKWFSAGAIVLPLAVLVSAGFIYKGWSDAQGLRFNEGLGQILDNFSRLSLYGISASCIALHPWSGGGSRSYSWECNQFWNATDHSGTNRLPEFVHNEFLQCLTDYGAVGGTLLAAVLIWVLGAALYRSCTGAMDPSKRSGDSLRVGAIAGLTAIFIQSSFSFVFHLLPGVFLLGIVLGRATTSDSFPGHGGSRSRKGWILIGIAVPVIITSLFYGYLGSRVTIALLPLYRDSAISRSDQIDRLSEAIRLWPQATLLSERAAQLQKSADSGDASLRWEAVEDYRKAMELHPFHAGIRVNLARLLAFLGDEHEAEKQFHYSTQLEGGLESAYRAHYHFSKYFNDKGYRQLEDRNDTAAVEAFIAGIQQFEELTRKNWWVPHHPEGIELQQSLFMGLGMAQEMGGDIEGALATYQSAIIQGGSSPINYRWGNLLGKTAETMWLERRPSEALTRFKQAYEKIGQATGLPAATETKRIQHLEYLDQRIKLLLDSGILPLDQN